MLLQNEYLAAENRILRAQLAAHLRLPNPERATLAQNVYDAKPEAILGGYRRLVAAKFDGSNRSPARGSPAGT